MFKFRGLMTKIFELYGITLTEITLETYWKLLEKYNYYDIESICTSYLSSSHALLVPKPTEIIKELMKLANKNGNHVADKTNSLKNRKLTSWHKIASLLQQS